MLLKASVRTPIGSYVLHDGEWYVVKERSNIPDNTAIIQSLKDITILDNWTGLSMKLHQTSWEETVGIRSLTNKDDGTTHLYTLDGRRVNTKAPQPAGIYLKATGGKTRKVIVK